MNNIISPKWNSHVWVGYSTFIFFYVYVSLSFSLSVSLPLSLSLYIYIYIIDMFEKGEISV